MNSYIEYNLLNYGMAAETNLNIINLKIKKTVRIHPEFKPFFISSWYEKALNKGYLRDSSENGRP